MKKTIHYQHPVLKYHACGMGDSLTIQMSANIEQVTCQRCSSTATGQKAKPGRPSEGKQRKNIWYDADVWELVKDLPQVKRGKVLNQIIRENISRYL